jgi:hypothetical protein
VRIHRALSRKFATPLEDLPALKTEQNFVNHYGQLRSAEARHDPRAGAGHAEVLLAGGGAGAASWSGRLWRAPQHDLLVWSAARSSSVAHKNWSLVRRTVRVVATRMGEWAQPGSGARRGTRAWPVRAYCGGGATVFVRFFNVKVTFPPIKPRDSKHIYHTNAKAHFRNVEVD